MNSELALRPATLPFSVRMLRGALAVRRLAWRLVLEAAPLCNLYWIVGMPPYREP